MELNKVANPKPNNVPNVAPNKPKINPSKTN